MISHTTLLDNTITTNSCMNSFGVSISITLVVFGFPLSTSPQARARRPLFVIQLSLGPPACQHANLRRINPRRRTSKSHIVLLCIVYACICGVAPWCTVRQRTVLWGVVVLFRLIFLIGPASLRGIGWLGLRQEDSSAAWRRRPPRRRPRLLMISSCRP